MKAAPAIRAALYLRVSVAPQHPENQARELRRFCRRAGWKIVREYTEKASGARGDREQLQACMEAASRREFDVLVFWSLDRLTREGALKSLDLLNRLNSYGVKYRSFREPYIDATAPFAEAIIGFVAAIARSERERIRERVHAGLARAREQGRIGGRRRFITDSVRMAQDAAAGKSYREIGRAFGCSAATALRRIREWRKQQEAEKQKGKKRHAWIPDRRNLHSGKRARRH